MARSECIVTTGSVTERYNGHYPTYATPTIYESTPTYASPYGPSLFPHYQEDDPWNLPFWDWFTPGGARGPSFDPNRPSKHVNNIPGNAAGMPMVMTNPDWKRNRGRQGRRCVDPAFPGPIEAEPIVATVDNLNDSNRCNLAPYSVLALCTEAFYKKFKYKTPDDACKSLGPRYRSARPKPSPRLQHGCGGPVELCEKANCEPYENALDSVGSCLCCEPDVIKSFNPVVTGWAPYR